MQHSKGISLSCTHLRQRVQAGNRANEVYDAAEQNVDVQELGDGRVAASAISKQDHACRRAHGRNAQSGDNERIHLAISKWCSGMGSVTASGAYELTRTLLPLR